MGNKKTLFRYFFGIWLLLASLVAEADELELKFIEEKFGPEQTELHKLRAQQDELVLETTNSAELETFLASIAEPELKKEILSRVSGDNRLRDSAQLLSFGDAALSLGLKSQALSAFRKALELDPKSLNAYYALAKVTDDREEKSRCYLKSLSTEALTNVADAWFGAANKSLTEVGSLNARTQVPSSTTIAAAMIPYQFAILKEPSNAALRYQFARKLESAGLSYYDHASKRYLEAAALAKQKFLAGDKSVESLLRDSIESLIRTLSIQGDFEQAVKYCHSYMALGYEKFTDGDSIRGVLRRVQVRRNPFTRLESGGLKYES